MADFTFVTSRLATGAAVTSDSDVQALIAAGITHVVDLRAEFDDTPLLATRPQISYLWNGVPDDGNPATHGDAWFAKSLAFTLPALALPHAKALYHCAAGINRGPSTVFAVMLALGFTAVNAEAIIRAARPQVGLAYKAEAIDSVARLGYV